MPRFSPKTIGKSGGGRGRRLFNVKGILFNTGEITSYLDKRTKAAFESIGKRLRRDIRRSLKPTKRYSKISDIPKHKDQYYALLRQSLRIQERMYLRGERSTPPIMPYIPSKPGKAPKIHSADSLLKKGILYSYEPGRRTVVVGAAKARSSSSNAPSVLEYGGRVSVRMPYTGERVMKKIEERGYVRKSYRRLSQNGTIMKIFAKRMKV